jgi:hypothetical protein
MSARLDDGLFDRANEADFSAATGLTLWRAGRSLRGPCPICGASAGKGADGAFAWRLDHRRWHCFAEGKGGDLVSLVAELRRLSPVAAATWILGEEGQAAPARVAPKRPPTPPREPSAIAAQIWAGSRCAVNSPVADYLTARGITGPVRDAALRNLRFHPAAFWGKGDSAWVYLPAIVARPRTPAGECEGVHVTYLAQDGRSKTHRSPAKRMWGAQADAEGRPGGVWLIGPDGDAPVIAGEGIESSLSAAILMAEPRRVVATLSLRALQGGALQDDWGRIDPDMPRPDPERTPFVWPGIGRAYVAVDRDMKPVRCKVRRPTGGTAERVLGADDRARLCATLAVAAWTRSGALASSIAPSAGCDFNDELLGRD